MKCSILVSRKYPYCFLLAKKCASNIKLLKNFVNLSCQNYKNWQKKKGENLKLAFEFRCFPAGHKNTNFTRGANYSWISVMDQTDKKCFIVICLKFGMLMFLWHSKIHILLEYHWKIKLKNLHFDFFSLFLILPKLILYATSDQLIFLYQIYWSIWFVDLQSWCFQWYFYVFWWTMFDTNVTNDVFIGRWCVKQYFIIFILTLDNLMSGPAIISKISSLQEKENKQNFQFLVYVKKDFNWYKNKKANCSGD